MKEEYSYRSPIYGDLCAEVTIERETKMVKEEKETMKEALIVAFYCFIAVGIVNAATFVFVLCCGCIDNSLSSLALLSALISSFITTAVSIGSICGLQESSKSKSKSKIKFQKHD